MPKKDDDKNQDPPVSSLIQKKFLEERKVFLWGEVMDESAKEITEKLHYLEAVDPGKPINLYINTPGGSVTAGYAIYDTIKLISSEVNVIVTGLAASWGAVLLAAPKKGNRYVYPHATVMMHQPLISGQYRGHAVDINIFAENMEKTKEEINQIFAEATGQPIEKIREDTDRDFYLNAQGAVDYGLADHIVDKI